MTVSVQERHLGQWETGLRRQCTVEPHSRFLGYFTINSEEERIFGIIFQPVKRVWFRTTEITANSQLRWLRRKDMGVILSVPPGGLLNTLRLASWRQKFLSLRMCPDGKFWASCGLLSSILFCNVAFCILPEFAIIAIMGNVHSFHSICVRVSQRIILFIIRISFPERPAYCLSEKKKEIKSAANWSSWDHVNCWLCRGGVCSVCLAAGVGREEEGEFVYFSVFLFAFQQKDKMIWAQVSGTWTVKNVLPDFGRKLGE